MPSVYKRGEHDLRKPACFEYCKRAGENCPFVNYNNGEGVKDVSINRWTTTIGDSEHKLSYKNVAATTPDSEKQVSPCSCWGDGSGFEYDTPQRHLIGPSARMEMYYDIFNYGVSHNILQQKDNNWNAWIDKAQPDFRFGRVSDTNAETVLFPNVNNPWMFTEYVFKGSDKNDAKYFIIEPPLYDPDTLTLINGDLTLESVNSFDKKYVKESKNGTKVKQFRKITNWDSWNQSSSSDETGSNYTVANAGVKLYKVNVNVQCVKWGEHGNIPPHTLDMTAPEDFLDPTKIVTKIKAKTKAIIGSPLYASSYGVLSFNSSTNEFFISKPTSLTLQTDAEGNLSYSYTSSAYSGVRQNTPPWPLNKPGGIIGDGKRKSLNPDYKQDDGAYIHGGCGLCYGKGGLSVEDNGSGNETKTKGVLRCSKLDSLKKDTAEYEIIKGKFQGVSGCLSFNNADHCPYFVSSPEYPVIATYQKEAQNMGEYYSAMGCAVSSATAGRDQTAKNLLEYGTGLPTADMFIAMGALNHATVNVRGDTTIPQDVTVTYITEFVVENAEKEMPKMNKEPKEFCEGLQILPDTGKFAFDSRENTSVMGNDETLLHDDISPLSFHRFFNSVLHCATQGDCNELCGLNQQQGFNPDTRAGGNGKCRYYKGFRDQNSKGLHGCPYTSVPKRAVEFSETMQIVSPLLDGMGKTITELSQGGFWDIPEPKNLLYSDMWKHEDGCVAYADLLFELNGTKISVYSKENIGNYYGGIEMKEKGSGDYKYLLCYMKAEVNNITIQDGDDEKTVRFTKVTDTFFYYKPLDDLGGSITQSASQHVDTDGMWLCKSDVDFVPPSTNCVMIDNEKKFIGGYHPQYKDYGQRGQEFIMEKESDVEREGHAMGDITNDSEYSGVTQSVNKEGYWVDESGVYIIDERSTGVDQPIADDDTRENTSGPATCISFKKSNTSLSGETGERNPPKTTNGAVYANDSYNVIQTYKKSRSVDTSTGKITGRPMFQDPESDNMYYAPLICYQPELLPTMRKGLHCPKCDYYIAWKYKNQEKKCPWCGTTYEDITGNAGPRDSGDSWDASAKVLKKFFKLNAIGQVQVWGPPGTCVHTDAYFWKSPNVVSNALKRQIYHRLGQPNKGGGGYAMGSMSKESELTLGYPEGLGYFKKIPPDWKTDSTKPYHKSKIKWDETIDPTKTGGYNGIAPKNYFPYWNDGSDERVIAPYTTTSTNENGNNSDVAALKMISYEQMRVLRNALEPVLAYTSNKPWQGDYQVNRASYKDRTSADQNIIFRNKKATISPIVLAYTGGADAYQEYYSGDLSYGNVRQYYPPGFTWWFQNQCLGGRCSDLTQGQYHMDGGIGWAPSCCWPTTSQTIAKCAIFIHGILPLDKEIIAAYVIVSPGGPEPSRDPVGRSWSGGPVMYHHYHSKVKGHFNKGNDAHLHGTAGYPQGTYFDDDGNFVDERPPGVHYYSDDVEFQDYSDYRLWGSNNPKEAALVSTIENRFFDTMTNLPAMMDMEFYTNVGTEKEDIYINDKKAGKGYKYMVQITDEDGNPLDVPNENLKGMAFQNITIIPEVSERKYQYCLINSDGDLIQSYPNETIWKVNSEKQLEDTIEKYTSTFEFSVSDGSKENSVSYTFTQTNSKLYNDFVPHNSQGITGYFDMSWTNTTGSIYGTGYKVESSKGEVWDYPVIFQEGGTGSGGYGGSTAEEQIGNVTRCIDCTSVVKKLYDTRIERSFGCKAGNTLDEVTKMKFPTINLEGALLSADSDCLLANQKADADEDEHSDDYNLADCNSYPKLDSDGILPSISPDGDKYELAEKKAVITCSVLFPITIYKENSYYVKKEKDEKTDKETTKDVALGKKTITTMASLESTIKTVLPDVTFEKKSSTEYEITSTSVLEIPSGDKYIYGSLGISSGTHPIQQSRVVTCSSYVPGYHPSNLFNGTSGGWVFNSFRPQTQNFVVDLVRAPLLLKQRDYRFEPSSVDYSNCKCWDENCLAHDTTCSVAANLRGVHWNSSSSICPFGHDLEQGSTEGKIEKPGDGIMTYEYAPMFSPDPFIKTIEITPKNCKWSVAIKYSKHDEWQTISDNDVSKSGKQTITIDYNDPDKRKRARYVKVNCIPEEQDVSYSFDVIEFKNFEVKCKGDFSEFEDFSFAGYTFDAGGEKIKIVSMSINENQDECTFYVGVDLTEEGFSVSKVEIQAKKYIGGIESMAIKGFHYIDQPIPEDVKELKFLTITDAEDEWYTNIDVKTTKYTLGHYPTKIYSVQVGQPNEGGIVLTESTSKDNLLWTTEDVTLTDAGKQYKIKKITGGQYYYDPYFNTITIPKKSSDGLKWNEFEKELIGTNIRVSHLPSRLSVRYFSGNGKSVVLFAEAAGNGPSYQLEKDAIQVIETTSAFESNGTTGKMIDVSGSIINGKSFDWTCYNELPCTLGIEQSSRRVQTGKINATTSSGEFRKPTFMGNEIADKDNDDAFVELFGNHQEGCWGRCQTEMVFTGAPNRIISGKISVKAKDYTQKTVQLDENKSVTYYERTGGLNNGCLIVKIPVTNASGGLDTQTMGLPTLLIYAKEKKPTS